MTKNNQPIVRWKEVSGLKGKYLVSDVGDIYSIKSKRNIKSFVSRIGYHDVYFKTNKKTTIKKLHRIVAKEFVPNPLRRPHVNHLDGNKSNNRFDNLQWVSHSENIKHGFSIGLIKPKRGSLNGNSKLNNKKVIKIINYLKTGSYSMTAISKKFKVSVTTIYYIKNKKTWRHIYE